MGWEKRNTSLYTTHIAIPMHVCMLVCMHHVSTMHNIHLQAEVQMDTSSLHVPSNTLQVCMHLSSNTQPTNHPRIHTDTHHRYSTHTDTHTHTHTRTHARMHARTHACTHARTHTHTQLMPMYMHCHCEQNI